LAGLRVRVEVRRVRMGGVGERKVEVRRVRKGGRGQKG